MMLRFVNADGKQVAVHLKSKSAVTIGRGQEADVRLTDPQVSRLHCEIRLWADDFVLKDLKSNNGTCVNEARVEVAVLKAGDKIRIGSTTLHVEKEPQKGPQTILMEVVAEREKGDKGYGTMLRQIVGTIDGQGKRKDRKP